MAPEIPTGTSPTPVLFDAKVLGDAIAEGITRTQRRKVSFGEYMARQPKKHTLTRQCFQNTFELHEHQLTNEQITLLNKIDRGGRYCNRLVEVVLKQNGPDEIVIIRWSCRTKDQRFALQEYFKDFTDLLKQIVAVQDAADKTADDAAHPARPFGGNKQTREAEAKAGVAR